MIVAVGSKNPCKVEAVREAFERIYGGVTIKSLKVETKPQPIGVKETIRGAVKRGVKALELTPDATYGVGIEAGLIKVPYTITGYFSTQICAIVDRELRVTLGSSSGFEFPVKAVEAVKEGEALEVEEVIEEITGVKAIGEKIGAIGFLSRNNIDRRTLSIESVICALIPRINKGLYSNSWPSAREILLNL